SACKEARARLPCLFVLFALGSHNENYVKQGTNQSFNILSQRIELAATGLTPRSASTNTFQYPTPADRTCSASAAAHARIAAWFQYPTPADRTCSCRDPRPVDANNACFSILPQRIE